MSAEGILTLKDLLRQTEAAISTSESQLMVAMTPEEKWDLLNKYGPFDYIIGDFLIKCLHGGNVANAPISSIRLDCTMKRERLISLLRVSRLHSIYLRGHSPNSKDTINEHLNKLEAAIKVLKESDESLASAPEEAHNLCMSDERETNHLIHALHDLSKELVRTTGELRSLLLILSKHDLGNTEKIEMKVSELTGTVNDVKASALKAFAEIRNRIDAADARIVILETQLADADVPASAETALTELKAIHKQLDDIVPDPTDLPPVVTPPVPA